MGIDGDDRRVTASVGWMNGTSGGDGREGGEGQAGRRFLGHGWGSMDDDQSGSG